MISYSKLSLWCLYAFLLSTPVIFIALHLAEYTQSVIHMSIFSTLYFTAFCFLALALGKTVIKSKDLNAINKLFMVLVFLKLASALGLFLIFMYIYEPVERWFVLPFIGMYITFTAVEVISLKSLSKSK